MVKSGFYLIGLALLFSCKSKKGDSGDEGFSYEDFSEKFPSSNLPYQISDTGLLNNKDTSTIRSVEFAAFIPDSLKTKWFGKNAKSRFVSQTQIKGDESSFYIVKASSGNKKASLLVVFDKGRYSAVFPLLIPDADPTTGQLTTIDKNLGITKTTSRKTSEAVVEGREVFQYNAASKQFILVLTNPLDNTPGEVINPIDTFSRKHKFAGDYGKDKKNIVSIRDGRYPNQLMLFIHVDKNDGECTGELKGELLLTSATAAVYRQAGDPCVMTFRFSGNSVTIKEDQGCGAHRGLDCSFDGTFSRKKELKPKPAKKVPASK